MDIQSSNLVLMLSTETITKHYHQKIKGQGIKVLRYLCVCDIEDYNSRTGGHITFALGTQVLHSIPNSHCHFEVNRSKIEVTKPKGPGAKLAIIYERMIMIVKLDGYNYCGAIVATYK